MKRRNPGSHRSPVNLLGPPSSDDEHEERQTTGQEIIEDDIVIPSEDMGVVITPEEQRLFERIDRLDGKKGPKKRTKFESDAPPNDPIRKESLASMPFDYRKRTELESEFNLLLNASMKTVFENKMFAGKDDVVNKIMYGTTDKKQLYKFVDIFQDPGDISDTLKFVPEPMKRKLSSLDAYDRVEVKWRPVDLAWKRREFSKAGFPAGLGVNIISVAEFIENNSMVDVWALEMTIPSDHEETPEWVVQYFNDSRVKAAGVLSLDLVLEPKTLFHLRLIYIYGVVDDGTPLQSPPLFIHESNFRQCLEQAKIPVGENRLQYERRRILHSDEPDPIFRIPFTYVGRYYCVPTPIEKIEANSLARQLNKGKLLWDLQPVFDAYDDEEEEESTKTNKMSTKTAKKPDADQKPMAQKSTSKKDEGGIIEE